ncbi:MAG: SoxR reducing system RseC family protein [Bacteroidetes bacterium]|nr:SoxR reducing system RseC family protein [Bacteroidota bacterium]
MKNVLQSCSCKPGEEKTKLISAADPFGTAKGDVVKISVKGSNILKATILLYGIPLIILVISIFVGLILFSESAQPEMYSFLSAI